MAVIAIGDLQLDDNRPWSYEIAKRMVDYIIEHPVNNSSNIAVFLGDITEKAFISGQIIALLEKLFHNLKYRKVYVLVGNHELKTNKVGQETYVLDFLKSPSYPNIEIVEKAQAFAEGNDSFLMLPWFNPTKDHTMKSEYENMTWGGRAKPFTAVFGHLQEASLDLPGESIDLSGIPTKYFCLGHIHNPSEKCLGSMVPNAVSEAQKLRRFQSFDKGEMEIIPIRTLMDYYDVVYPDPLPKIDCDVPVFTVYNCADENVAKEKYGDIYIRKCVYEVSMDLEALRAVGSNMASLGALTSKELFDQFKKTAKFNPPEIGVLAEKYLFS